MARRFDFVPQGRGLSGVHRTLRVITILVAVFGVVFLGYSYYNRARSKGDAGARDGGGAGRASAGKTGEGTEYSVDLRTLALPPVGDNAGVAQPPDNAIALPPAADNALEVAAIVGIESIRDGATIERQPLYYFLREAEEKFPANDYFMKRAPVVTLAQLRADPDKYRAKPVIVRGEILRLDRSAIEPNPSGIREVLDGDLLVEKEGICMFLATRSVMPVVGGRTVGPRVGDKVELRGLFMKLVTYAGQGGTQENAPLIITSHPVFYRPPRASGSGGSALEGLIFLAVMLFVIYFALMFFLRRRQEGKNRQIEARRKARELLGRPSAHEEVDEPSKPAEPAQGGDELKEP